MMTDIRANPDVIQQYESVAAEAMPALTTRFYDGWLLRFTNGYTRRGNSVHPLYASSVNIDEKIKYCENLYLRQQLPVIFKLTEASHPSNLEARLADAGYATGPSVYIQTLALDKIETRPAVSGSVRLTDTWMNAYTSMNGVPEQHHSTLRAMLQKVLAQTWYALLKDENNVPIAVGLGIMNGSLFGIFDVVVAPARRNQGIGSRLIGELLSWGKSRGAQTAYLQVNAENTAGLRLYHRTGFREAYRYWYRIKEK